MKPHTLRIKIDEGENGVSISSNTIASFGDTELNFLPRYMINMGYHKYHFKLAETNRPERVLWVGPKLANKLSLEEGQTVNLSLSDAPELSEVTFEHKHVDAIALPELVPGIEISIRDEYLHNGEALRVLSASSENGYITSSTVIHIVEKTKSSDKSGSIKPTSLKKQDTPKGINILGFRTLYTEVKSKVQIPFERPELSKKYLGKSLNAVLFKLPDGTPISKVIDKLAEDSNAIRISLSIKKACDSSSINEYINEKYEQAMKSPGRAIVYIYDTSVLQDSNDGGSVAQSAIFDAINMTLMDEKVITIVEALSESDAAFWLENTGQFQICMEIKHPSQQDREEYIKAFLSVNSNLIDKDIQALAKRMQGYSLIDLQQVMRRVGTEAMTKSVISSSDEQITYDLILKQVQEKNMGTSGFGEFRMKIPERSFDGLYGYDELTKQLKDILDMQTGEREVKYDYRKNPNILLYGPPGNGKTHIAEACAYHAGCSYFSFSATQLMNKWVGESARGVRKIFNAAREQAPTIIHIDEIDGIVAHRENTHLAQVINQLRTEMEGITSNNGVIVIATTNHIDEIDAPILSRFNHQLHVDLPDEAALAKIIDAYFSPIDEANFNPTDLAKMLIGHSPRKIREIRDKICHMLNTGEKTSIRMSDIMALIEYQTPKNLTTILNHRLS